MHISAAVQFHFVSLKIGVARANPSSWSLQFVCLCSPSASHFSLTSTLRYTLFILLPGFGRHTLCGRFSPKGNLISLGSVYTSLKITNNTRHGKRMGRINAFIMSTNESNKFSVGVRCGQRFATVKHTKKATRDGHAALNTMKI